MPRADFRDIRGRRRDLRGVRGADALRAISVEGPGIGSLAGLERMLALEVVHLERLRDPDLGVLVDLPSLRHVDIERPTGSVPWRVIERLVQIESLRLDVAEDSAADVAAIDFGALEALEHLRLMTSASVPVDVSWAPRRDRLRGLGLQGFFIPEGAEEPLCECTQLRSVGITTLTKSQYARLVDRLPAADVFMPFWDGEGVAPLGVVFEPEPGVTDQFSVGLDLAGTWDFETNSEAEALLRRELRRRAPALLEALAFDSESSAVWLVADRREDLDTARAFVDEVSARRRSRP